MKKKIKLTTAIILSMSLLTGCAGLRREMKSIKSDLANGLYRTVTVYDYNGGEIKTWEGKFDVSESENEVYFDVDGKRVIIHGGIVINEEK